MEERMLTLRLCWDGPVQRQPGESGTGATEFGMQRGRDEVVPGARQPNGSVLYETTVTAYIDARGRLRYRGPCVQGPPEEPFLYLSYRYAGQRGWIGRGKAHLTSLTADFLSSLPDGAILESAMSNLGHRSAHHVQKWTRVEV